MGNSNKNYGLSSESNLISLLVIQNNALIKEKIQKMGPQFDPNAPLNFMGDTILHYACYQNNENLNNEINTQLQGQNTEIVSNEQQNQINVFMISKPFFDHYHYKKRESLLQPNIIQIYKPIVMSKKLFEQIILRTALTTITQNQYLLSAFATISNIQNVLYISKKDKQKKMYCIICEEKFNNALLFILHLQLQHKKGPSNKIIVQKYVVSQNILKVYQHNRNQMDIEINDFFLPIGKAGQGASCYLFKSQANRTKIILSQIAKKIVQQKIPQKKSQFQFYYHSTNIFNKTKFQEECVDSEQEMNTVERQLYEKEINEFKDVNEYDKKFFIEWNTFVESYKAKGSVIYPQCLENLLSDFASQLALLSETDMRLNLVMHAWTLWSLGQINSQLIISILEKYDKERNKFKGKTI